MTTLHISKMIFQIANPTVLEKPGALMLAPIYKLLFGTWSRDLLLTEDQIAISYKTYKNHNPADMQEIVDQKLAAGNEIHLILLFIIFD